MSRDVELMGPGFFIFFQNPAPPTPGIEKGIDIFKDDAEILDFIMEFVTEKI